MQPRQAHGGEFANLIVRPRILSEDKTLVFAAGLGHEINSRACLWVLLRPRHLAKCWLTIQRCIFLLMFFLETPKDGSGPANILNRTVSCELVGDFVSSYPSLSRGPVQPHSLPGRGIIRRLLALLFQWTNIPGASQMWFRVSHNWIWCFWSFFFVGGVSASYKLQDPFSAQDLTVSRLTTHIWVVPHL